MQSNNPVFRRSEEFNSANAYGNQTYAGGGVPTAGYGQPPASPDSRVGAPMTIDSVVQKTGDRPGRRDHHRGRDLDRHP